MSSRNRVSPRWAAPFTCRKSPPAYTVPAGPVARAYTGPSSAGAKSSTCPVPSRYAKRLLRWRYVRPAESVTREKSPPTTTVSPTTAMARTVPSRTCGVKSTGSAETTADWAWSASAGAVAARPASRAPRRTATLRRIPRISSCPGPKRRTPETTSQPGQRAAATPPMCSP